MRDFHLLATRSLQQHWAPAIHSWDNEDGSAWVTFHRSDDEYLIRVIDHADFLISHDGTICSCCPAPETCDQTLDHLFRNIVLPLMQNRQGHLVLHASCVKTNGGAIAFIGETGQGKSTLTAAFCAHGAEFLSDDCLLVKPSDGGFLAHPGDPSVRLWGDTFDIFASHGATLAPPISYTSKSRLLAGPNLPHCTQSQPLLAIYMLHDQGADRTGIHPLKTRDILPAFGKSNFYLDTEDQQALARNFHQIVDLASCVPCFTLDYPRNYAALSNVISAILAHTTNLDLAA